MERRRESELMDDPAVEERAHAHALRTLNRVNRLLRIDQVLYDQLHRLSPSGLESVLDLGSGGGGFLGFVGQRREALPNHPPQEIAVAALHQPQLRGMLLIGLDRSSFALNLAKRWHGSGVHWICGDAMRIPMADESVDVVTCSLFLHHFDETSAANILREAARVARCGVVVGDLSRSRPAWAVTWAATRLLSRSRLFHVDGPRSVRAAFRAEELAYVAQRAGLVGAKVARRFPFRLLLTWRKGAQLRVTP